MLSGELLTIINLLKSYEIEAIAYKGPILAFKIYDNISFRTFNDLDIFIKKSNAIKLIKILNTLEYDSFFYSKGELKPAYLKSQKGIVLTNKKSGLFLDTQWKISGNFFSFPTKPENLLMNNLKNFNFQNNEFKVFSNENMFIILSMHAAGHQWSRLSWLCDISELIKKDELDWYEIMDNSQKLGVNRIINTNLILINYLFKTEIPAQVSKIVFSDTTAKKLALQTMKDIFTNDKKKNKLIKWASFHLKIRENLINGIMDSIMHATIPSIKELEKLKLPARLYPIYYLFKPFNLIIRYKL